MQVNIKIRMVAEMHSHPVETKEEIPKVTQEVLMEIKWIGSPLETRINIITSRINSKFRVRVRYKDRFNSRDRSVISLTTI